MFKAHRKVGFFITNFDHSFLLASESGKVRASVYLDDLSMLSIRSLTVNTRLLPLSFDAAAGEVVHIVGPNGSGKSTLLSAIAGMIEFGGEAQLFDEQITELSVETLASRRAYLTQSGKPPFAIGVAQYLSLSVPSFVEPNSPHITAAVEELSALLKLEDKLHRSIAELSGGEWQRVRLAGICLQVWPTLNPYARLLLLDEPAAPLDIGQEALLYQLIRRMAQMGLIVLMANHDLNRALQFADKTLVLKKGVLVDFGVASEVMTSQTLSDVFASHVQRVEFNGKNVLVFD